MSINEYCTAVFKFCTGMQLNYSDIMSQQQHGTQCALASQKTGTQQTGSQLTGIPSEVSENGHLFRCIPVWPSPPYKNNLHTHVQAQRRKPEFSLLIDHNKDKNKNTPVKFLAFQIFGDCACIGLRGDEEAKCFKFNCHDFTSRIIPLSGLLSGSQTLKFASLLHAVSKSASSESCRSILIPDSVN